MTRFPPIKKIIFELNGITNFELSPSFTLLMLIAYLIRGKELDEQRDSEKEGGGRLLEICCHLHGA